MKDEEKKLIENLFNRLKKTELNSSERDEPADNLIQKLVQKQPASSYYMAQTILIQETAIKKMSMKIEELKEKIKTLNIEESNKKPSFLSSFFKKNPTASATSRDDKIWQKKENFLQKNSHSNSTASPMQQTLPVTNSGSSTGGFLSSALQTATGVAGGMILGNMLMNVFNHTKPEEEIFDTVNNSSLDHQTEDNFFNDHTASNNDFMNDNNLIHYEHNGSEIESSESDSENINYDFDNTDDIDDFDSNDDNFI